MDKNNVVVMPIRSALGVLHLRIGGKTYTLRPRLRENPSATRKRAKVFVINTGVSRNSPGTRRHAASPSYAIERGYEPDDLPAVKHGPER